MEEIDQLINKPRRSTLIAQKKKKKKNQEIDQLIHNPSSSILIVQRRPNQHLCFLVNPEKEDKRRTPDLFFHAVIFSIDHQLNDTKIQIFCVQRIKTGLLRLIWWGVVPIKPA